MHGLLWIGAAIVTVLAGYAGWLLGRLWQQHRRIRQTEVLRRQQTCDSLEIIARSLIADQVNVTEAALRMEVLLHNVDDPQPRTDLSPIHALAQACGELSVGKARNELPAGERQRQDSLREKEEARHGESVKQAARGLLQVLPGWRRQ